MENESVLEKRILIAQLAESILSKPDAAFSSNNQGDNKTEKSKTDDYDAGVVFSNLSKMRMLLELANPNPKILRMNDEQTARLAIVSLLAIFKDILPTYRIRQPTAAELAVRVSKDVKRLRDYERNLLTSYQSYLKLLEILWTNGQPQRNKSQKKNSQYIPNASPSPLAITAMLSLAELLKSAFLFNFRSNILSIVVKSMNSKCEEISQSCNEAIREIFMKDLQGDVSLEAVRLIASMMKKRNFNVKEGIVQTFLALPLRVHEDEAEAAKIHEKAMNKKRKKDQERANIEDELKEGNTTVDKTILARAQAETLQIVILTYFRILKMRSGGHGKETSSQLLPVALEGLAKFSHLVNIDTVEDLLKHLKYLLNDIDSIAFDAALNSILTAFNTLLGPGRELQIDQKEYIVPLYSQLPRLCSQSVIQHTNLVLRSLNLAFLKRREFSPVRIAAFMKQICTVALHTPPFCASALLAFVRLLLHRYPQIHQLLENEMDVVTSGKYSPEVEDPDHANPFAAASWELATLKFHVHPSLADHAVCASTLKTPQLPRDSPDNVYQKMLNHTDLEFYIPFKLLKRKHPLRSSIEKNANKRKRSQVRFITPKKTKLWHLQS